MTSATTICRRGTLVLVRFVFADEKGAKQRPVLVLSGDTYHRARREAIVAAVTSHVGRRLPGDHVVGDWESAGLVAPSIVTGILRTIKQDMIVRELGTLPAADLRAVEHSLQTVLELNGVR